MNRYEFIMQQWSGLQGEARDGFVSVLASELVNLDIMVDRQEKILDAYCEAIERLTAQIVLLSTPRLHVKSDLAAES